MPAETPRRIVFVTYTMFNPHAVGVFFRALRLGMEFRRRGWNFKVFNVGPIPDEDPKVQLARGCGGEIVSMEFDNAEEQIPAIRKQLFEERPDLIVLGELPFPPMVPFYDALRMGNAPFVVLDQFYNADAMPHGYRLGVDGIFIYGLRGIWSPPPKPRFPYEIIPPFIDEVTPDRQLSLPEEARELPRVTILGLDERVLQRGIEIVAGHQLAVVAISRDPAAAEERMQAAGIPPERRRSLPLLSDADLYGWISTSRITITANGFMQMMEVLALGCPAICVDRGIGMWPWSLARQLQPYVSLCEELEKQRQKLAEWLEKSPFSDDQRRALHTERQGARVCADYLEGVANRRRLLGRIERWGLRVDWTLRSKLRGTKTKTLEPPSAGGTAAT
jgi:hypothetical protein